LANGIDQSGNCLVVRRKLSFVFVDPVSKIPIRGEEQPQPHKRAHDEDAGCDRT